MRGGLLSHKFVSLTSKFGCQLEERAPHSKPTSASSQSPSCEEFQTFAREGTRASPSLSLNWGLIIVALHRYSLQCNLREEVRLPCPTCRLYIQSSLRHSRRPCPGARVLLLHNPLL
ncbi:hypothetical protein M758_2G232700 [Ceratodon purpureus]|nr:hypothetical protein M758_2G232700 [Ceratodon purpureus]